MVCTWEATALIFKVNRRPWDQDRERMMCMERLHQASVTGLGTCRWVSHRSSLMEFRSSGLEEAEEGGNWDLNPAALASALAVTVCVHACVHAYACMTFK